MIPCPNCGADNKPAAKFCKICGKPLPALSHPAYPGSSLPMTRQPTALPQKNPTVFPLASQPIPLRSRSIAPLTSKPALPLTTRLQTALNPTTNLCGIVMDDPQERRDFPPRDWSKIMVILAVLIVVLPPVAIALSAAAAVLCILALLGAGAVFSCLFIPLGFLMGALGWMRGPQRSEVPILEMRVQEQGGNIVNVEIIGKRRGGRIARGDEIEATGEWLDGGRSAMRAYRVEIHRVMSLGGAQSAGGIVTADRPWPTAWGQAALVIAVVFAVIFYLVPIIGVPLLQALGFKF